MRPSISKLFYTFSLSIRILETVTGAWKEPHPGWIRGLMGATGFCVEGGCGMLKTVSVNGKHTFEIIPVDIVVNTIITSAWFTSTYT